MKRVPDYIQRFQEKLNQQPKLEPKLFTFQPQINQPPSTPQTARGSAAGASAAAVAGASPVAAASASADAPLSARRPASARPSSASFLSRVKEDQNLRAARATELARLSAPPFKPTISEGSLRRLERARATKGIPHSFLERLDDDLERREEHERAQQRMRNTVPFTFTPDLSATAGLSASGSISGDSNSSSSGGSTARQLDFHAFLARMEEDVASREDHFRRREALLATKAPLVPAAPGSPAPPPRARPQSARMRRAAQLMT